LGRLGLVVAERRLLGLLLGEGLLLILGIALDDNLASVDGVAGAVFGRSFLRRFFDLFFAFLFALFFLFIGATLVLRGIQTIIYDFVS